MDAKDFLDEIHERYGWTDYRIAKVIGLTQSRVSQIRHGQAGLSETTAQRIADLLDRDPYFIYAVTRAGSAKKPEEKAFWSQFVKRLGALVAACSLGLSGISAPSPTQASTAPDKPSYVYYVKFLRRWLGWCVKGPQPVAA